MTAAPAATKPRKATPAKPPAHPCCQACGAVLYEDLLGRLRCLIPDCAKLREVVGQADIDPGVLTAEVLDG